jgi:ubiquinone biosynthesis protein Coq4
MVQHAYLRGKNAKFLLAENYDDLFNEDLEEARIRLNIPV